MDIIRVVLADDHPMMRRGIRNVLHGTRDIVVIGEASNGYEAVELVNKLSPNVLLLDMEMPGMKGLEVAQHLKASGSTVPILVLSAHEDKQFILGVLDTGASGYLTKEELPETVVRAVRGVARGEKGWISARLASLIGDWLKDRKRRRTRSFVDVY